jgi:hypothetical protein
MRANWSSGALRRDGAADFLFVGDRPETPLNHIALRAAMIADRIKRDRYFP